MLDGKIEMGDYDGEKIFKNDYCHCCHGGN